MLQLAAVAERLRSSLWFIPGLFALGAIVLAFLVLEVDRALSREAAGTFFLFGGTAEGARSVLSTIAQSMLTFTGLVFTITMLVLQLASSQLSPRVVRTFLRDRQNQIVLGLFVATFVYTLLVLRDVRAGTDQDDAFVPGLSIWIAFVLLLASVGAFIGYINHMAHAMRASTVIDSIFDETRGIIDRLYPEPIGREPAEPDLAAARESFGPPGATLKAERGGVLVAVDEEALLEAVGDGEDRIVELVPSVGDFVPEASALFRVWGEWDAGSAGELRRAVTLGRERTLQQDAPFGVRQLVDIATRALSPSTNDPTTAVQALDRIHDLLRRLATRRFPSPLRLVDGRPRLILHRAEWDDYVRLAIDEIRLSGANQVQIVRRLRSVLEDLVSIAPPGRRWILRHELDLLDRAVVRAFEDVADRSIARVPSGRGQGEVSPAGRREGGLEPHVGPPTGRS